MERQACLGLRLWIGWCAGLLICPSLPPSTSWPHLLMHRLHGGGCRSCLPLRHGVAQPLLLGLGQRSAQRAVLRLQVSLLERVALLGGGVVRAAGCVLHAGHPAAGNNLHPALQRRGSRGVGGEWPLPAVGPPRTMQDKARQLQEEGSIVSEGSKPARLALASAGEAAAKKWVWEPQARLNTQPAFLGLKSGLERSTCGTRPAVAAWRDVGGPGGG